MKNTGAIELSANFIVIIVISSIILIGGIALFFNLKDNVTSYSDSIDSQMMERVKRMMLNSGDRVAVFPAELSLDKGDGEAVGLGITNHNAETVYDIDVSVRYYADSNSESDTITDTNDYYDIMNEDDGVKVAQGEQVVKSVLIKVPKTAKEGQYIYTITVDDDPNVDGNYGIVQVYVNV